MKILVKSGQGKILTLGVNQKPMKIRQMSCIFTARSLDFGGSIQVTLSLMGTHLVFALWKTIACLLGTMLRPKSHLGLFQKLSISMILQKNTRMSVVLITSTIPVLKLA